MKNRNNSWHLRPLLRNGASALYELTNSSSEGSEFSRFLFPAFTPSLREEWRNEQGQGPQVCGKEVIYSQAFPGNIMNKFRRR